MKKKDFRPLIKFIIVVAILCALVAYLGWAVVDYCKHSELFKIKEVVVINNSVVFPSLRGRNILTASMQDIAREIRRACPGSKLVRVSKVMPNKIIIEFEKRVPLATLKLHHYYFVDAQGVLFDVPKDKPQIYYPIITGLAIENPRAGTRYAMKPLEDALRLTKEALRIGFYQKYPIKNIDVGNQEYIRFTIADNLEIKIIGSEIQEKLGVLQTLISQANLDLAKVEYIDLRYTDPAIKLKDVKEK